jgi:hypothetical protein
VNTGPDYIELQRCCHHDVQDLSKVLSADQVVVVQQSARRPRTVPVVSAAQFCRKLLTHTSHSKVLSMSARSSASSTTNAKVVEQNLQGAVVDDSIRPLKVYAEDTCWSELLRSCCAIRKSANSWNLKKLKTSNCQWTRGHTAMCDNFNFQANG